MIDSIIIDISEKFLSQYDRLPYKIKKKFQKQLRFLKENPKHPSLKIHRIESSDDFWEFYIDKGYRCIFKQVGNVYRLYFVGTHDLIDKAN